MYNRTSIILLAAVGLLLSGFAIYLAFSDDDKPNATGKLLSGFAEAGVKEGDITGVEIEAGTTKAVYSKEAGGRWRCLEPLKVRVDATAIEAMIRDLLSAGVVEKGVEISRDPAKLGLTDKPVAVTLKKGVDREATVSLGTVTVGGDRAVVYVLSSDRPGRPQAVRRSALRALFKPQAGAGEAAALVLAPDDLRERRLLGVGIQDVVSQVDAIAVSRGKQVLGLQRQGGGVWTFAEPANYGEAEVEIPASTPNPQALYSVRQLISQAIDLQVREAKDFIDAPADLAKYGLNADNPDALRIDLKRPGAAKGEPPFTERLFVGKPVENAADEVYARYEGDNAVAKIKGEGVKFIRNTLENPTTLRSKDLLRLDAGRVDAVEIANASGKIELRRGAAETSWNIFDGDAAEPANATFIQNLLQRLGEKGLVREFPPANYTAQTMGIAESSPKVRIWEGGAAGPKPADGKPAKFPLKEKPTVELTFGKKNVDTVYVRRTQNGRDADFEIPNNVLDQLVNRPKLEYVEVKLKSFNPPEVMKAAVRVGGETLLLERDGEKWKIAGPESLKGRFAEADKVQRMLLELARLQPLKAVAKNLEPSKLASLKLDEKTAKMAVTLSLKDEKDKERTYFFGDDSEEKTGQLLKVPDSPYVVEVTKAIFMTNNNLPDFADRQVYKVDASKVVGLKMTGWVPQTGDKPLVREFEKKDGQWAKKTNLNYEIDPGAVVNFLTDATNVKAVLLLGTKAVKPEYKLDLAQGATEVVLTLEGGKAVTLTLGGEDPKFDQIYATSSENGGEVFELNKDRFHALRENLTVFKKIP